MSRHLRRSIAKNRRAKDKEIQDILSRGAAQRQAVAADDLMVIGGQKFDLSRDYADGLPEGMDPDMIFPRFVTASGKVYDLDAEDEDGEKSGKEVSMADTIEIDNRVLKIGDFGGNAACMVVELYEQFLNATHNAQQAYYHERDYSHQIPDYVTDENSRRMLQSKTDFKKAVTIHFVDWGDQDVTFEHWMQWSAATTRWRIKSDLKRRYEHNLDIRKRQTMQSAKDVLEPTLVAIEKFLALPERKRLTAV